MVKENSSEGWTTQPLIVMIFIAMKYHLPQLHIPHKQLGVYCMYIPTYTCINKIAIHIAL